MCRTRVLVVWRKPSACLACGLTAVVCRFAGCQSFVCEEEGCPGRRAAAAWQKNQLTSRKHFPLSWRCGGTKQGKTLKVKRSFIHSCSDLSATLPCIHWLSVRVCQEPSVSVHLHPPSQIPADPLADRIRGSGGVAGLWGPLLPPSLPSAPVSTLLIQVPLRGSIGWLYIYKYIYIQYVAKASTQQYCLTRGPWELHRAWWLLGQRESRWRRCRGWESCCSHSSVVSQTPKCARCTGSSHGCSEALRGGSPRKTWSHSKKEKGTSEFYSVETKVLYTKQYISNKK